MQCGNKSHLSEVKAWASARKFRRRGEAVHAYHCSKCGYWHIGKDRRGIDGYRAGKEEERMGAYLDGIDRRSRSHQKNPEAPDTAKCRRCGGMSLAENVDDCLGCSSVDLCPDCMTAHNCATRALQLDGIKRRDAR